MNPEGSANRWWILSATGLGALTATLNSGTLIIALPVLLRELHTNLLSLIWILLAYNLTQTVLVMNVGRLSDMFGRKQLYVGGFVLFTLASLLAGFTPNAAALIAVRILQGVGGAFMIANSGAIVADAFPRRELGLALGTNQMLVALGLVLGPVLGGWLVNFGWHWVFWFNVPIGVLGVFWAWRMLRQDGGLDRRDPIDYPGNLTYGVGLALAVIGLSIGGIESWSLGLPLIGIGLALLAVFVLLQTRVKAPMLDLKLFQYASFSLGNLTNFLGAISRQSLNFLFVFYFQGARGMDPITAGIALAPIAGGLLITAPFAGRLADRYGSYHLSWLGNALSTVASLGLALSLNLNTPYWQIALWMLVSGMGSGIFNSPNSSLILGSVPPDRRGIATGIRTLLTSVGSTLSIVFTISLVASSLPKDVLFKIFSGLATGLSQTALEPFSASTRLALWIMTLLGATATLVALLSHPLARPTQAKLASEKQRVEG
ncbi:MAG: MFS transporter [Thermaceae bacterium]|nr:MFS transporter [Thermaceae bacterium]